MNIIRRHRNNFSVEKFITCNEVCGVAEKNVHVKTLSESDESRIGDSNIRNILFRGAQPREKRLRLEIASVAPRCCSFAHVDVRTERKHAEPIVYKKYT